MRRGIILVLFFLMSSISITNVEARPPEIVIDPGGGGTTTSDACLRDTTEKTIITKNSVTDCSISSNSDVDTFKFQIFDDQDIYLFSKKTKSYDETININAKVYESTDLVNPIYTLTDSDGVGMHYTVHSEYFYKSFTVTAGKTYYVEVFVDPNFTETISNEVYSFYFQNCECVNDARYFLLDPYTVGVTYNSVFIDSQDDSIKEINYYTPETGSYLNEIIAAAEMWNILGVINFTRITDPNSNRVDLTIEYIYDPNSTSEGKYSYSSDEITLNLYQSANNDIGYRTMILGHEFGHSLGLNGDRYSQTKIDQYKVDSILTDWEITIGETEERNWSSVEAEEDVYNLMIYGVYEVTETGPCDREAYREIWGYNDY